MILQWLDSHVPLSIIPNRVKCHYNEVQFIAILHTETDNESDMKLTIDTPYLALMGEL